MATYVTETGLKNTFQSFLNKLKDWLPIKKSNDKVVITGPTYKEALEIDVDGEIKIIGTNSSPKSLRNWIDSKGTIVVQNYSEASQYISLDYLGSLIYIKESSEDYLEGLYAISINSNGGSIMISKIGMTTSSDEDLGVRVDRLENWIDNPLTVGDIDILTDDDPTNDNQIYN